MSIDTASAAPVLLGRGATPTPISTSGAKVIAPTANVDGKSLKFKAVLPGSGSDPDFVQDVTYDLTIE